MSKLEQAKNVVADIAAEEGVELDEYTDGWDDASYVEECEAQGYVWTGSRWEWTEENEA